MKKLIPFFAVALLLAPIVPVSAAQDDFQRMFPKLAPFQPAESLLVNLAASMQEAAAEPNDNPGVPAGFTYLGQFLDHDMTLDVTPLGDVTNISDLVDGRTSVLDLDSLYGGGPGVSPQLYDSQGRFLFSSPNGFSDLLRNSDGTAIIPEPRNDENLIIAQIHIAFQKFHNHYIDQGLSFAEAQKQVQWHWQWIVTHDYLPEVLGQDTVDHFLSYNGDGKPQIHYEFFKADNPHSPTVPIEFSVAAFRFGHSQVRQAYFLPTNATARTQVFSPAFPATQDLRGSRPIPPSLKIDFNNFFNVPGVPVPSTRNVSRKIDSRVSAGLFALPIGPVVPPNPPTVTSLPERNLLRSARLGLPSYQDVATAMGITPLTNAQLGLTDPDWNGKAPLWYGILKESEIVDNGTRLGPVGRNIVAETILGFIDKDHNSYFNASQPWTPTDGHTPGEFHIYDLLALGGAIPPITP